VKGGKKKGRREKLCRQGEEVSKEDGGVCRGGCEPRIGVQWTVGKGSKQRNNLAAVLMAGGDKWWVKNERTEGDGIGSKRGEFVTW